MPNTAFYQKLSELDLKEMVDFIDHNQTQFTIKINNQYVKANVTYIKSSKYFAVLRFHDFDFSNEQVVCSFRYKDEVYIFNSNLNATKLEYLIDIPSEIYQLQRRNDFRVNIPIGMFHTCKVQYLRGLKRDVTVELRDISMGGCQLAAPSLELDFEQDNDFDIYLKIDKFEFQRINLIAKHLKHIKEQHTYLIGASFAGLDVDQQSEMRSLLMFIDRKNRGKE